MATQLTEVFFMQKDLLEIGSLPEGSQRHFANLTISKGGIKGINVLIHRGSATITFEREDHAAIRSSNTQEED